MKSNRHLVLCVCLALLLPLSATSVSQRGSGTAGVTVNDVVKMIQAKIPDDVIISQLQRNQTPLNLSTDDLIRLKTAGASDDVIRAMAAPRTTSPTTAPNAAASSPRLEEQEATSLFGALVTTQSEGRIKLLSFRKTDGQSAVMAGVPIYRMAFEATIEFTKDAKWLREPFSRLEFKMREVPKTANGRDTWGDFFEASQNPGVMVKAGQTAGLAGALSFERSERGWNLSPLSEIKVVSEPGGTGGTVTRGTSPTPTPVDRPATTATGGASGEYKNAPPVPPEAETTSMGVPTLVLKAGTGSDHPRRGSRIDVMLTSWLPDGRSFPDRKSTWTLGSGTPALDQTVMLMVVGEKRRIWIPERMRNPRELPVVFDIELLALRR